MVYTPDSFANIALPAFFDLFSTFSKKVGKVGKRSPKFFKAREQNLDK
jgi:hypothetical protein